MRKIALKLACWLIKKFHLDFIEKSFVIIAGVNQIVPYEDLTKTTIKEPENLIKSALAMKLCDFLISGNLLDIKREDYIGIGMKYEVTLRIIK